jgi:hypothetical protein
MLVKASLLFSKAAAEVLPVDIGASPAPSESRFVAVGFSVLLESLLSVLGFPMSRIFWSPSFHFLRNVIQRECKSSLIDFTEAQWLVYSKASLMAKKVMKRVKISAPTMTH